MDSPNSMASKTGGQTRNDAETLAWGRRLLEKAKNTAMERAALDAYNAHFFKCTPSCSAKDWTTAWKKAVAWWSEPVTRVDPTACPECIGMGCEACNRTGDRAAKTTGATNG